MRETFEEAYQALKSIDFRAELKVIANAMIWVTIPFWVIPYAIVRKIKEIFNGK